ncbi:hypothetical protein [Motiliproteus sp. SC1-56]|uniref:hypothetical protein n=1 Tax=Motiliproteus sp. SC1-56 TaxID=2799565 RepID=UPI001A8C139E|nr:hypothetical protein [Motiliproteus sp. SC1-56]
MRALFILAGLLAFSASSANAAEGGLLFKGEEALIAYKDEFSVEVVDRVTDGCLPNPGAIKTRMEAALEAGGLKTAQAQAPLGDQVVVSLLGYSVAPGSCLLYAEAWLNHWLVARVPYAKQVETGQETYFAARHPLGQQLRYLNKSATQSQAAKAADDFAARLASDIKASRQYAAENFPAMEAEYRRLQSAR